MSAGGRPRGGSSRPRARRPLRVRAGTLADAPVLARIMRAAIRGAPSGPYSPAEVRAWSSLPALYHRWAMTAGGERYVVAEDRGRAVGYAARRGAELTAVFVLPRAAGGGVGGALVGRVERAARAAGAAKLRVEAALGAVPFYARLGYVAGKAARVALPGGATLAAVQMEKRLAPLARGAGRPRAARAPRTFGRRGPPRGR